MDVQKTAAFDQEMDHIKQLGVKIMWPVVTKEITDQGIIADDGRFIPGDMVIIAVGELPELDYLPAEIAKFRNWGLANSDRSILDGVFAAGDMIKPGLLIHAITTEGKAAMAADAYV